MNPLTWGPRQSDSQRQKVGQSLLEAEGGGIGELVSNGHKASVWEGAQALKMDSSDGRTTWMCLMPQTAHPQMTKWEIVTYILPHETQMSTFNAFSNEWPGPVDHAGTPPITLLLSQPWRSLCLYQGGLGPGGLWRSAAEAVTRHDPTWHGPESPSTDLHRASRVTPYRANMQEGAPRQTAQTICSCELPMFPLFPYLFLFLKNILYFFGLVFQCLKKKESLLLFSFYCYFLKVLLLFSLFPHLTLNLY